MKITEIKQKVINQIFKNKMVVNADHIIKKGHDINKHEIKMVLLHGRHAFDKNHKDRYLAFGYYNKKKIRVVYEFQNINDNDYLIVITAFED